MPTRFRWDPPLLTVVLLWFSIKVIQYYMDLPNWTQGAHVDAGARRRVQSGPLNRISGRRKDAHQDGGKTRAVSGPVYEDDVPWMLREGGDVVGLRVYALPPFFFCQRRSSRMKIVGFAFRIEDEERLQHLNAKLGWNLSQSVRELLARAIVQGPSVDVVLPTAVSPEVEEVHVG